MRTAAFKTAAPEPRTSTSALWLIPVLALVCVWLLQAFASGGYLSRQWLPAGIIVASLALALFAFGAFPQVPARIPLVVAGALTAYTVWMAVTAAWAPSGGSAWMAAGRSATYVLVFLLTSTMCRAESGRIALKYGLAAVAAVLVVTCVWKFFATSDLASMFVEDRLAYPVGYPNNAAALYLIPFWPLLWMAADPREKWYLRGLILGLSTALVMLAYLTQSRGAFWAFALATVAFFLLSPARLRALAHLAVVLGVTILAYPSLNLYWAEGPAAVGVAPLLTRFIPCTVAAIAVGWIVSLLDPRLRFTPRGRMVAGILAVALLVSAALSGLAATGGGLTATFNSVRTQWAGFIDDLRGLAPGQTPNSSGDESANPSRFLIPGSSGRWDLWRVAWLDFERAPATGMGAGNYAFSYNRDRIRDRYGRDAHSLPLGTLAETGFVGGLLLFGGLGLAVGAVVVPRTAAAIRNGRRLLRRGPPPQETAVGPARGGTTCPIDYDSAWTMALLTAVIYWLFHSSVDWLWEMTAVTIPALLCLALALAEVTQSRAPRQDRSSLFRWVTVGLAGLALMGLGLPYMALRYNDMAVANMPTDPTLARQQARVAAALAPANAEPLLVQQRLYQAAAEDAVHLGARLDNLALALNAAEQAVARDSANWVTLLTAAKAAEALADEVQGASGQTIEAPGDSPGSLATTAHAQSVSGHYLKMTPRELRDLARSYATRAHEWNPKEPQTTELLTRLSAGQ